MTTSRYKEIDMYDTELKQARPYGNHKWTLLPNSKNILVVKCCNCNIARLFLVGHDIINCMPTIERDCK